MQKKAESIEELKENCATLADYIEKKINKTIYWQESRKKPSIFQLMIADEKMKKR